MLSAKSAQNVRSRIDKVVARLKTAQRRYGCVFIRIKKEDKHINFEIESALYHTVCIIQSTLLESKDTLLMIKSELINVGVKITLNYDEWMKVSCRPYG